MKSISSELLEHLETGIEILVLLQYDASPMLSELNCIECTECERKENGCALGIRPIEYIEEPIYISFTHKEYHNCPISLIHPIIYTFNDRYSFIKEFNQSMDPTTTPSLFWWFVKTYNRIKSNVQTQMHEESLKKNNRAP